MNTEGGYIRLFRRVWDHAAFRNRHEAAVFAWMVSEARWQAGSVRTDFGCVDLGVGELLISERQVAEDFGMHRNTLRAMIHRLIAHGMLTTRHDPHRRSIGTIVNVSNYLKYQGVGCNNLDDQDQGQDQGRTRAGPGQDQGRTTYKEKEGKEDSVAPNGSTGADAPTKPELRVVHPQPVEPPAKPTRDAVKELWDRGVAQLGESSRSLIGKMRRKYGDLVVMEAIVACERECPSNPIEFFIGRLKWENGNANRKQGPITGLYEGAYLAAQDFIAAQERGGNPGGSSPGDEVVVPLLGHRRAPGEPPGADDGLDRGSDRVRGGLRG